MIHIKIKRPYKKKVLIDLLERAAQTALAHEHVTTNVELTIVVDSDNTLQALNKQFLGIDAPTDVLSFPADEIDPDQQLQYIGDVVISFERTIQQAESAGHSVEAELCLLAVHGILHLLGYDHAEETDKARMWTSQKEILDLLNISIQGLPG